MQHHSDKLVLTIHLSFVVDIDCIQHIVQWLQLRETDTQTAEQYQVTNAGSFKLSRSNMALNSVDTIFFCIIWLIITEHNVQM